MLNGVCWLPVGGIPFRDRGSAPDLDGTRKGIIHTGVDSKSVAYCDVFRELIKRDVAIETLPNFIMHVITLVRSVSV